MEKNSLLAVVLSFIVLTLWWMNMSRTTAKHLPENPEAVSGETTAVTFNPPDRKRPRADTDAGYPDEGIFEIQNNRIRCQFGKESGRIKHLYLKEKLGEVDLIMPNQPNPFIFAAGATKPAVSLMNNSVKISYPEMTCKFYFNDMYLTLDASSSGGSPVEVIWCGGIGTDPELLEEQRKRKLQKFHYKNGKVKKISKPLSKKLNEWISISNRYFLLAFFPGTETYFSCDPANPSGLIQFTSQKGSLTLNILAAQKDYAVLSGRGEGLEKTMSLGLFSFLSVFFINILKFFYTLTGNYGWSICILTIIIQFFMFPLSRKNIRSAAAMKRIQPYVEKLKKKHTDNPKKMNEELLNLYKVQKVNPLGGCLPLVIQIPIFWSLFTMLQGLVELRGAPFIFWLTDLSRPDSLFGYLPKILPLIGGWPVGPLPLLMGVTMFMQQKMTITDPQQKMFLLMPVFFTFIFLKFPSGLVLYWLTSNIITFIEHLILTKDK